MAKKDREKLREIIDSIEVSDFDFKEVKSEGEIGTHEIKVKDYIDTDSKRMHKVTIPKITVSISQLRSKDECWEQFWIKYYNEKSEEVEKYYERRYSFNMNEETYNSFKSTIENVEFIKTKVHILYALFSNKDKLEQIKKLKLFTSLSTRLYYGPPFKGWTGEKFAYVEMEAPIYTERHKILNLVDCLTEYKEVDKVKLVKAYKAFLHKELTKCEKED
ncbi:hypothetical protein [Ruminococcus sp.]|uniref:hypothetical protein n=1 Tax=Ruminococcus sp. TaxID=41978 RepID=UPI0025F80B68|nr:hypothetical protein [Ruminococcus sp.]MBQ6252489.1 hypothetical protein [Ruminococcus sp.]